MLLVQDQIIVDVSRSIAAGGGGGGWSIEVAVVELVVYRASSGKNPATPYTARTFSMVIVLQQTELPVTATSFPITVGGGGTAIW